MGVLTIDPATRHVSVDGRHVDVTATEFEVLLALSERRLRSRCWP